MLPPVVLVACCGTILLAGRNASLLLPLTAAPLFFFSPASLAGFTTAFSLIADCFGFDWFLSAAFFAGAA